MDSELNVPALMPESLSWDRSSFVRATVRCPRLKFGNEAVASQLASQRGGWDALRSFVDQSVDRRSSRKDPNRIVDFHAMTGAIGDQTGLRRAHRGDRRLGHAASRRSARPRCRRDSGAVRQGR